MSDVLTIGELAERSGVATSALRFYEDKGLIQAQRNSSGHRRYPRAVIRRVAFIVFAQRIGLSLEEIGAELAKLPRHHVPERADWTKLSSGWTRSIRERIAELERLEAGLSECIGCGCLSLDRCRFANPGDRAARRGAGPRYWLEDPRRRKSPEGFTVVEILVVVVLVALGTVCGIALRNSRIHANEAGAVAILRAVYDAEVQYAARCAHGGYAFDLEDLRKPGLQDPDGFISRRVLPDTRYHGYVIALGRSEALETTYLPVTTCNDSTGTPVTGFFATASPAILGLSGTRFFAIDQHGQLAEDIRPLLNSSIGTAPNDPTARR